MTVEAATAARSPYDEWRDRRWRVVGLLLGTMAIVTAALLVTTGMRPAAYGDLLSDVASGKADEVHVAGPDAPAEGDSVELRWTVLAGVLDQYAVVQVAGSAGDPRETLRSINSDLRITSGSVTDVPSVSFLGWRVPDAVALLALTTWLGALFLIGSGPEPWRATRWAWGWAWLLAGPLGTVAYLLVGGPLGVGRPRPGHRRLTGGWAFLLFGGLLGGARSS